MKKILIFLSFFLISIGVQGATVTFTFSDIASSNNWINGYVYTPVSISPITIYGNGGGNNAKYYASDKTWRMYNRGAVNITATSGYTITAVSSNPSQTFTISNGAATLSCTATIKFKSITVTYSSSQQTTYTVIYDANGGTGTMTDTNSPYNSGATVTTLTNTFTKDGYTFTKWNTAADGSGTDYTEGATFSINANTTLYAQWTKNVIPPMPVECNGDFYDFSNIIGFSSWRTGYSTRKVIYTNDSVVFTSANRQTTTITDIPVTKGQDIIVKSRDGKKISSISLTCRQWENKSQTITLHYSIDGGSSFTSTGMSSTNFKLSYNGFNSNVNAIKFTFSSSNNQIGIESLCVEHEACTKTVSVRKGPETNGTFSIDKTEICIDTAGGTVNVTDIIPANGYVFDTIICVSAKEPTTPIGVVNLSEYKVTNITDSCYIFATFKEKSNIDIAEWNPDYIKVNIDNFDGVTAIIENQNTQAHVEQNFADSVFFSKYFEAKGNVKLLALYNGTDHNVNLSGYKIQFGENGNGSYSTYTYSHTINIDTILEQGKELIFISYLEGDSAITKCARENPKSGWNNYIISPIQLKFNGNDAISLLNKQNEIIDIIGAGNKDKENLSSVISKKEFMDDDGWYSADGINLNTNDSNYALSTNRCLLVRKNTVKSGLNAVSRNTTDFVTLGGIYGEWKGLQIPKTAADQGTQASCDGFNDVGEYNYNEYYTQYDTIINNISIQDSLQSDGTHKIAIPKLDTLSCTNLKLVVKDGQGKELSKIYKIPIMVKMNSLTTDELFTKEGSDCATCDVVVLANKVLTAAGTSSQNRDIKVYEGGKLSIPSGTTYTVNSLSLRQTNDIMSSLSLSGNLILSGDSNLYYDLYTDPSGWRWIALPEEFNINNIKLSNGKSVTYGDDYLIKIYDGQYRSVNKKNGWKSVSSDKVFSKGEGFIFGIAGGGLIKKEFRFKFSNDALLREKANKEIAWETLKSWGCNNSELAPNHKGWNLIGNPFMSELNTEIYTPIRIGHLIKDMSSGYWNGQWLVDPTETDERLRYIVVKAKPGEQTDDGTYRQELLDEVVLNPFECVFVQLGSTIETTHEINFNTTSRRSIVARRSLEQKEVEKELFLRIYVGNEKTGMFISNKFTEEYEPGDDFESRRPIYQTIGGYKLLYSAINDSIIENGVQIHSNGGKVTLDTKVETEKFEQIYILYNNEWYDLLNGDEPEVSGDFILYGKRKVSEDIPTDIRNIKPGQGTYKFLHENNIFINNKGKIYNIFGSQVK